MTEGQAMNKLPESVESWIADNVQGFEDDHGFLRTAVEMEDLEKLFADCARSHPHEDMNPMCVMRCEIARVRNEYANLLANNHPVIAAKLARQEALLAEKEAEIAELREDLNHCSFAHDKASALLTQICKTLKGDDPEGGLYSFHDLPEIVERLQSRVVELEASAVSRESLADDLREISRMAVFRLPHNERWFVTLREAIAALSAPSQPTAKEAKE